MLFQKHNEERYRDDMTSLLTYLLKVDLETLRPTLVNYSLPETNRSLLYNGYISFQNTALLGEVFVSLLKKIEGKVVSDPGARASCIEHTLVPSPPTYQLRVTMQGGQEAVTLTSNAEELSPPLGSLWDKAQAFTEDTPHRKLRGMFQDLVLRREREGSTEQRKNNALSKT